MQNHSCRLGWPEAATHKPTQQPSDNAPGNLVQVARGGKHSLGSRGESVRRLQITQSALISGAPHYLQMDFRVEMFNLKMWGIENTPQENSRTRSVIFPLVPLPEQP